MFRARVIRGVSVVAILLTALTLAATAARADPTGTITGQVVDANGTPLAGICVEYSTVPYSGWPVPSTRTDTNGRYTITLSAGAYLIDFQGCGQNYVGQFYPGQPGYTTAGNVTIVAGQATGGVDARMAVGGTITGKVLDQATGTPPPQSDIGIEPQLLAPTPVSSTYAPDTLASTTVAADGTYTLAGLPPGSYRVYFSAMFGGPNPYASAWYPDQPDPGHATTVTVQSGQTASLGVELAEASGTVTGRVTDVNGMPLSGYNVMSSIPEPDGSTFYGYSLPVSSGADGTFTLTGLAPGTWTINAFRNGDGQYIQSKPVIVQAGANTPNLDFTFCVGTECPPTRLLALTTRISDHALFFAGQSSDPAYAGLTIVLNGHVGRRKVHIRGRDYDVKGGSFSYSMPLPRRDWALRSGVLVLDFGATQAATGGHFVASVPSVRAGTPSKPAHHHHKRRHKHKRKRKRRPKHIA